MTHDPIKTAMTAYAIHVDIMRAAQRAVNKHLHKDHISDARIANSTMLFAWAMSTDQLLGMMEYSVEHFAKLLADAHNFKANYKGPH